jgi:hypothetical protein
MPYTPSLRLSSEPLHDRISTESKATTPSQPLDLCRAWPETQLSQEGCLHTGRDTVDEHELVNRALDTLINKGARKQQRVVQEEGNNENKHEGLQQEVNIVALEVIIEKTSKSPRPANLRQSLPNLNLSPESSYIKARKPKR